jgi:hypothetical protein
VNGKTNELDFLRENFHMETGQQQIVATPACAEDMEMSQHSTHLQNRNQRRGRKKKGRYHPKVNEPRRRKITAPRTKLGYSVPRLLGSFVFPYFFVITGEGFLIGVPLTCSFHYIK